MPAIAVNRLAHNLDLPLPAYETGGAAGMDLRAAVPHDAPITLSPGARALASVAAQLRAILDPPPPV